MKYFLLLLILSTSTGLVGSIMFGSNIRISILDVFIFINSIYWIINYKEAVKVIKKNIPGSSFLLFIAVGLISLLVNPLNLKWNDLGVSSLYLIRLMAYFTVFLSTVHWNNRFVHSRMSPIVALVVCGILFAGMGWLQYFLYPDLINLKYLGWDPHYMRIFSTLFDPNYLGLVMILSLVLLWYSKLSTNVKWVASLLFLATLLFTYSRSSFLTLAAVVLIYIITSRKIKYLLIIPVAALSLFLLPRPGGEGIKLERVFSINQRLDHLKLGGEIFTKYPVLGVGFDTLRYAKVRIDTSGINWFDSNAGAGLDNSYLFILVTTGIVGLAAYSNFIYRSYLNLSKSIRLAFAAILIHSLFINSLFFPVIMVWMWVILGTGKLKGNT